MGGSGGEITTGYEYFGGLCQVICAGEITRLTRIANGDTVIWSGDITPDSRDSDGKTALTTTIGTGHLYWGREDELPNADLEAAIVNFGTGPTTLAIPAWRRWAKFIMAECAFGGQPAPPTLNFDYERKLNLLSISAHDIQGDAVLPEVVYDVLSNALYSVGINPARLDAESFAAAAETIILEGLGVSPELDETTRLRDFIGTLLQYVDGMLYWHNGMVKMKLVRKEDSAGAVVISESAMTDEPDIGGASMTDTWNFTRLVFNDRENNWDKQAVETYDDHANASVQGEHVPKDIELPFITRRNVAKILARRRGIAGGIPQVTITLRLLPSYRTLKPGDLIAVTYAKLGLAAKLFRVTRRETGGSDNNATVIEAAAEITRTEANDYVPPADPVFNLGAFYDGEGHATGTLETSVARMLWLPAGLKEGEPDGALIAFARPTDSTTRFQIWWTWDPVQKAYAKLEDGSEFPVMFTLRGWMRCRNNTAWLLRGVFGSQADADYVRQLVTEGKTIHIVTARRVYKQTGSVIDQHQVDGIWCKADVNGRVTPVSGLLYDIEVSDAQFSSTGLSLETDAGQASYPCTVCYAGRLKDFYRREMSSIKFEQLLGNGSNFWSSGVLQNTDTALVRYFKVRGGSRTEYEDLAAVPATTYDRDDTAMCPNGTLSNQWGSASPTLYEVYDMAGGAQALGGYTDSDGTVADIDQALYAAAFGLSTVEQDFLVESIEEVLAYKVQTGVEFYNKTS